MNSRNMSYMRMKEILNNFVNLLKETDNIKNIITEKYKKFSNFCQD